MDLAHVPSYTEYHLTDDDFKVQSYTFKDTIAVGIFEDLKIDFSTLEL